MTAAHRSTANRLISDKGQTVTITHYAAGTYDPATGTAAIVETTQTGKGVILPLAGYRKVGIGNIAAGDETLLLSALNSAGAALTAPKVDDTVIVGGGLAPTHSLVVIDPLHPDGLDCLYDCVARSYQ